MMKVKLWQLIVSAVLVVVFLSGIMVATSPAKQVKSREVLASYEHKGTFDYTAYLKPSFLYGSLPQPGEAQGSAGPTQAPLAAVKYPAEAVNQFLFNLAYTFTAVPQEPNLSSNCHIVAHGANVTGGKRDIILSVPKPGPGTQFTVDFVLPVDDTMAGGNIVVDVMIYTTAQLASGPVYETFPYQFTIRRESGMLVIDRILQKNISGNLGSFSYTQSCNINYQVEIRDETSQNLLVVAPPPLDATSEEMPELTRINAGNPIFVRLLEKIEASFIYELSANPAFTNLSKIVEIEAELQAGNVWSKKIILVPSTNLAGPVQFKVDYAGLMGLMDGIREETGASAESYNLIIRAIVQVSGDTPYGKVRETFSPYLTASNQGGLLVWQGALQQGKSGKIDKEVVTSHKRSIFGLSGTPLLIISLVVGLLFLGLFIFLAIMYMKNQEKIQVSAVSRQVLDYQKRYAGRITEAVAGIMHDDNTRIAVDSMANLVKVAEELGKPIIHLAARDGGRTIHRYQVYDAAINYAYQLTDDEDAAVGE